MAGKELDGQFDPVRRALDGIRFGSVEITIHDAKIVQIERREKIRVERVEPKHVTRPSP